MSNRNEPKKPLNYFPNLSYRRWSFLFCPGEQILDKTETICLQQEKFGNDTKKFWFRFSKRYRNVCPSVFDVTNGVMWYPSTPIHVQCTTMYIYIPCLFLSILSFIHGTKRQLQRPNSSSLTGGYSRLWLRVVLPARQDPQAGWPVRQLYVRVDYIPQLGTKNWLSACITSDRDGGDVQSSVK